MINAPIEEIYLDLHKGEHLKDEFVKLNPLHKVPFIVHDGLKLNESRAIITYLANRFLPDDNVMYPKDIVKRAQVDEIIHLDASLYAAGSKIFYPIFFGLTKKFDEKSEEYFRAYLKYFSSRIEGNGGKKYILSDDLTIADVSLAASLSMPEACGYDMSEFKPLVDYLGRVKSGIPCYDEVNTKAIQHMAEFFKSKLAA